MRIRWGEKDFRAESKSDRAAKQVSGPAQRPDVGGWKAGTAQHAVATPRARRRLKPARLFREYAEEIVETSPVSLLILDEQMRVRSANRYFYQSFRTSQEETLGLSIFELGNGQWNLLRLRRLLEELLPQNIGIDDFELEQEFPVIGRRHMRLNARQIGDTGKSAGRILLVIQDVTGQVEAAQALEASHARYRAIVEDQTDLILRFLPDATLTFVNESSCRHWGKGLEELIGQNVIETLVDEADRIPFWGFLEGLSEAQPVGTYVRQKAEAGGRWRQWIVRAFFDDRGEKIEFQAAGRDITELKKNEEALVRTQEDLHALTARLLTAQEEGSKHLARELHDVVSQNLAVLGMEISAIERKAREVPESLGDELRQIAVRIDNLAEGIHQMSRRLHPAILDELGLTAALNNECAGFSGQYGIPVELTIQNVPTRLPEDVSLCLYRVAQESLRNVFKHARASNVRVSLMGGNAEIELVIEDAGVGFDLGASKSNGSLGLVSMDERVRLVNGSFSIQSAPETGTCVEVRVPLRKRKA